MIYFTADTHFGHENVIRFCGRPYTTAAEMDEALIENWNSRVKGNDTVFIYVLCVVLIYLILSCLYESFLVPWAVILSVPCGLMGSFLFAKIFELENNIYLQTGVIMLIGLLAKTAILITEFASERRRRGMGIVEAAYTAAQARFRPIMMTVLTMIFGMLPLMFATGAGANGNSSLGTGVVGGITIGTIALLFITPVFFIAPCTQLKHVAQKRQFGSRELLRKEIAQRHLHARRIGIVTIHNQGVALCLAALRPVVRRNIGGNGMADALFGHFEIAADRHRRSDIQPVV